MNDHTTQPLHQGQDRHLTGDGAWWIDPSHPLPQGILFQPTDPRAHRGGTVGWAIVAGLALLGLPGMLYLGESGFAGGLVAVACVAGLLAWISHRRAENAARRRGMQLAQGQWRFGRFASSDLYLVRESKDYCYAVARTSFQRCTVGQEIITVNEKSRYRRFTLVIKYRLEDGREVGFQDFQCDGRLTSQEDLDQARRKVEEQRELFESWGRTGDLSMLRKALEMRR